MRIWLAPSAFHPSRGGVEELTLQLARDYRRRGHEVTVVVHQHPPALPARDEVEGVAVRRVRMDLPGRRVRRLLGYPLQLRRQLQDLEALGPAPDLVHVQCAANQVVPLWAFSRRHRSPFVITTQGEVTMDATAVYQESALMRLSLRAAARRADALTACSHRAGEDAATVAPAFRGCAVIPNGVDLRQWTVAPLPSEPVFVAWGRHVPQKGLDLLIRAFAGVRRTLPDAVLRIGGDGPETDSLRAMDVPGVEFVGPLDRQGVQALLHSARVAVVPSRLEPFGIVGVEAMATGRSVVWSTNGGLGEATGGLGWGVDPTDTDALTATLLEAHTSPLPVETVRTHAESLGWESIGSRYLGLYDDVLSRTS